MVGAQEFHAGHHDKPLIPKAQPAQLCCWLGGILSLNYYSVLYLQPQSLAIKSAFKCLGSQLHSSLSSYCLVDRNYL